MEMEEGPIEEIGKELFLSGNFSLGKLFQRAYEGLGHPNNDRFVRILKYVNAKPNMIENAKKFQCSLCQ